MKSKVNGQGLQWVKWAKWKNSLKQYNKKPDRAGIIMNESNKHKLQPAKKIKQI
jgi:hypothetical protein